MTPEQPFQVRISVDHMRHEIVHAMGRWTGETEQHIDEACKAAIAAFDFTGEAAKVMSAEIRAQLDWSIRAAITKIFSSEDMQQEIEGAVLRVLRARTELVPPPRANNRERPT